MDYRYEKEADGESIPGSGQGAGCQPADPGDSARSVSSGCAADRVCTEVPIESSRSQPDSKKSVGRLRGQQSTQGVRKIDGDSTVASGVHSQAVAEGRHTRIRIGMKTVASVVEKGGTGKSTTTVNLAFDLLKRGFRVAVGDLDRQGNTSFSLRKYKCGLKATQLFDGIDAATIKKTGLKLEDKKSPALVLIEGDKSILAVDDRPLKGLIANLKKSIQALDDEGYDFFLLDTPPGLGSRVLAALFTSDYAYSPIRLDLYSYMGFDLTRDIITQAQAGKAGIPGNSKLVYLGMIANQVNARSVTQEEIRQLIIKKYGNLLAPVSISLRDSISEATTRGLPIWELPQTAARPAVKELRGFADYILKSMNLEVK